MKNSTGAISLNSTTTISKTCPVDTEFFTILKLVAYVIIIIVSITGNIAVIVAVRRDTVMNRTMNLYVANICAADLGITLVYLPRVVVKYAIRSSRWIVGGTLGSILCKLVPYTYHVAVIASILTLLALGIDRFLAVFFPLKRRSTIAKTRNGKITTVLIWLTALVARFPYFYVLTLKKSSTTLTCSSSFANRFDNHLFVRNMYYTFLLVAFYAVPLVLTCVLYLMIIIHLRGRQKPGTREEIYTRKPQTFETKFRKAIKKTIYMFITISVAFSLCWGMHFFAQVIFRTVPCDIRFWRMFLAHINSAVSPCVFLALNPHYRRLLESPRVMTRVYSLRKVFPDQPLQPRSAIM